jgi:hypothetical protein
MADDVDRFAEGYFRVGRALRDDASAEERGWLEALGAESPASLLDDLILEKPEDGWLLMLAVVERAASEEDLAFVAARPIEDLVRHHGRAFADRLVVEARGNPQFRGALNYLWGWDEFPGDVWVEMAPLLDPDVRASWAAARAEGEFARDAFDAVSRPATKTHAKDRWRPPKLGPGPSGSRDTSRR